MNMEQKIADFIKFCNDSDAVEAEENKSYDNSYHLKLAAEAFTAGFESEEYYYLTCMGWSDEALRSFEDFENYLSK